jgi:7,8-dihydroneopterin aldolase/epimerase/oxygenase
MVVAEVSELAPPQVPELREAVEEEDRLALAASDVVHPAFLQVGVVMLELADRDGRDSLSRSSTLASVDEHEEAAHPSVEVEIRGLSIYTHHGVTDAEQEVGQRLEFDLTFDVPDCDAVLTDRIEDTVDYSEVCDIVALAATEKSYRTLERLGQVVAGRLMERFDCESVRVRAAKPEPPLPYVVQEAGVEVTLERSLDREPDDEEGL